MSMLGLEPRLHSKALFSQQAMMPSSHSRDEGCEKINEYYCQGVTFWENKTMINRMGILRKLNQPFVHGHQASDWDEIAVNSSPHCSHSCSPKPECFLQGYVECGFLKHFFRTPVTTSPPRFSSLFTPELTWGQMPFLRK